jgi:GntR family transcriptional regulator
MPLASPARNATPRAELFSDIECRAISAAHPAPLYHQLYALIKRKIELGEVRHGAALPSELALSALFSVSRITSKRALDELESEQLVERRRGRGTHVRYRYTPNVLRAPLTGMLETLNVMGRETTIDVLSLERIAAPSAICAALHVPVGTLVDRAIRVRRFQGDAFAFYVSHTLALAAGRDARKHPHGEPSAYSQKALKTKTRLEIFRSMGIRLSAVEQVLSACAASAEVAHALGLAVGAPLLSLTRIYSDQNDRAIDHLYGLYRPDRFQYQMKLTAPQESRRTGDTSDMSRRTGEAADMSRRAGEAADMSVFPRNTTHAERAK